MIKILILILLIYFNNVHTQNCGKAKGGVGNVIGGSAIEHNQHPWIASVMSNDGGKFRYYCGAVVVSEKNLLTAAHCIQNKKKSIKLLPSNFAIVLGSHDLNEPYEIGREIRAVKNIFVHPNWNPYTENFDYDLAILELEHQITFNNYIQPICLWESFYEPAVKSGILVGYGKSEDQSKVHENIPKVLNVPFQTQEKCFLQFPELAKISSARTFCAGSADGTGACLGDSGGGLFIKISNTYYLRGIVSSSLRRELSCDVNAFSVYTDVLKFKSWIKTLKVDEDADKCGIMSSSSGLIQKGSFATRKEFPWMAIIDGNFRTSGALISHKHVVSILSAVADWNKELKKYVPPASVDRIKITLGILKTDDEYLMPIKASKVIFHPEHRYADNLPVINIALIELRSYIDFNEFVRPVCLWRFSHEVENAQLYAVGYGRGDAGEITNARKFAKMELVSRQICESKFDKQHNFMNESKTFCVRGSENGNPCHQDESLFVKYDERWYWRGFNIIRFFLSSNKNICSLSPVLYEDSAQYSQWLQDQIKD